MTDITHDDLVKRICEEWVKDGRSEDCFWEGWPECPTPEDSLTPRMVIDRIEELSNCVAVLEAKLAKAVEALTPSGDTKAEYAGEFHISVYAAEDEDGNEIWRKVPVDWTTIKAIMAAIKSRATLAALTETPHE
jgi:hypothetical protein